MLERVCPHCKQAGLVRVERVFKGGSAQTSLSCDACGHTWQESDDDPPETQRGRPRPAPRKPR